MRFEYLSLAVNNLRRRRTRSLLTMIGIFIGIAAVVSLISLGQGMQRAIEEQFFQLGADKVTVQTKGVSTGPPGSNSDVQLTEKDVDVVGRSQGVRIATDRIIEPITVEFNDKERFLYLVSLPEDTEERAMVLEVAGIEDDDILYGRMIRPNDRYKVVMSEDYYNDPSFDGKPLRVGDKVLINGQSTDVVGFFRKTGNPFADVSFIMNEEPMRDLLGMPDKVGMIAAEIDSGANLETVRENVARDLRNYRNVERGKEDFEVQTGAEVLETFKTVLNVVTSVLVGIAAISLLVGGIGIMNTMYTAVLERRREIGVMKAIGARNSDILSIFVLEAGILGIIGGAIGVGIGMTMSKMVEWAATASLGTTLIQANFPWYLILGALVFSFGIGSIAGVLPAMQASQLPPVEALRQ
jgi:putative ABC transport system permease protein